MPNIIDKQNEQATFNIAIVVSRFNEDITQTLLEGALGRLHELGFSEQQIQVVWVPGAVEIPLIAQQLACAQQYKAIVTFGSVIRGETGHYDFVCQQASDGCARVALDHNIPVLFGVLTTENKEQAWERAGGKVSHVGIEYIDSAVEMVLIKRELSQ